MNISNKTSVFIVVIIAVAGTAVIARSLANTPHSTNDVGLLYATKEGMETAQIFRANLDTSNPRRLTSDFNNEHEWARPSPDGKSILFMKADKGTSVNFAVQSNRLWIMDIEGNSQREVIDFQKRNSYGWTGIGHAEWSPGSDKIVLVATLLNFTSQLFVVDINGNNPEQITNTTTVDGQQANVTDPSWSLSNQIIFIRQWNCLGICGNHDVFKIDYATRAETRITNDPNWNYDPYISPDGSKYLWLSFRSSGLICPCDLMKGNVSGPLSPTPVIADGGANANGTFSSDGSKILFLKQVGLKQVMHQINIDGGSLIKLGSGESGIASFIPSQSSTDNDPDEERGAGQKDPATSTNENKDSTTSNSIKQSDQGSRNNTSSDNRERTSSNSRTSNPLSGTPLEAILPQSVSKSLQRNPTHFFTILVIIALIILLVPLFLILKRHKMKL